MISSRSHSLIRAARLHAFTVVELLVAISVLSLIVLVLFGLFDQVQKALRSNVAQVDVLEGGRAGMQLVAGQAEQLSAGNVTGSTNLYIALTAKPYQQTLLDAGTNRLNLLQEFFLLSHFNKSWFGTGYRVLQLSTNGIASQFATNGVGTLCRYSVPVNDADFPNLPSLLNTPGPGRTTNLFWKVMNPARDNLTNYQQVLDGVVHLRVRAFDNNGFLITNNLITNIPPGLIVGTNAFKNDVEFDYAFTNRALPAYLEVELGVLEPHVLERYRAFPNPTVASNFLARQVAAVHLFQERIPIRSAK